MFPNVTVSPRLPENSKCISSATDQKMPVQNNNRTLSVHNPAGTVHKTSGATLDVAPQKTGKLPPSLAERIILIIDNGLMGPGKMTPVNMASTAHKVLAESLVTGVTTATTRYGSALNRAAAAGIGNLSSALVQGTNPFALITMAMTAVHHGPGITSAVYGDKSTPVAVAQQAADLASIAVILDSIYSAITAGSPSTATRLLAQFGARYGAHRLAQHHLHQLCNRLSPEGQAFLEPWLQALAQIAIAAGIPDDRAISSDRSPGGVMGSNPATGQDAQRNRTSSHGEPASLNINTTMANFREDKFRGDEKAYAGSQLRAHSPSPRPCVDTGQTTRTCRTTGNTIGHLLQWPAVMAGEIRHFTQEQTRAFMAGAPEAAETAPYPVPDRYNVTTFPETVSDGWLVSGGKPSACFRYQAYPANQACMADSPLFVREAGSQLPAPGVVRLLELIREPEEGNIRQGNMGRYIDHALDHHSESSVNFTAREPVYHHQLDPDQFKPGSAFCVISSCDPEPGANGGDQAVYLFDFAAGNKTTTMTVHIGRNGFTRTDQEAVAILKARMQQQTSEEQSHHATPGRSETAKETADPKTESGHRGKRQARASGQLSTTIMTDMGQLPVGRARTALNTVCNQAEQTIRADFTVESDSSNPGEWFTDNTPDQKKWERHIAPKQCSTFKLTLIPASSGDKSARLSISSNENSIVTSIVGTAVEPDSPPLRIQPIGTLSLSDGYTHMTFTPNNTLVLAGDNQARYFPIRAGQTGQWQNEALSPSLSPDALLCPGPDGSLLESGASPNLNLRRQGQVKRLVPPPALVRGVTPKTRVAGNHLRFGRDCPSRLPPAYPGLIGGILELSKNGIWQRIRGSYSTFESNLACQDLGYPGAAASNIGFVCPEWADDPPMKLACKGTETSLRDCRVRGSFRYRPGRYYSLFCHAPATRLDEADCHIPAGKIGGRPKMQTSDGKWHSLNAAGYELNEAKVTCRGLGFSDENAEILPECNLLPDITSPELLNISCHGNEGSLYSCNNTLVNRGDNPTVHVACVPQPEFYARLNSALCPGEQEGAVKGRLEVRTGNTTWGTVCDDNFFWWDARTACRQLGLTYPEEVKSKIAGDYYDAEALGCQPSPDNQSLPIWLQHLFCLGSETSLRDCFIIDNTVSALKFGEHNCQHNKDVYLQCKVPSTLSGCGSNNTETILLQKEGIFSHNWKTGLTSTIQPRSDKGPLQWYSPDIYTYLNSNTTNVQLVRRKSAKDIFPESGSSLPISLAIMRGKPGSATVYGLTDVNNPELVKVSADNKGDGLISDHIGKLGGSGVTWLAASAEGLIAYGDGQQVSLAAIDSTQWYGLDPKPTATQQPVRNQPTATQQPATHQPTATQQPARNQPTTTQQPARNQPTATQQPARNQPTAAQQPARNQPTATQQPSGHQEEDRLPLIIGATVSGLAAVGIGMISLNAIKLRQVHRDLPRRQLIKKAAVKSVTDPLFLCRRQSIIHQRSQEQLAMNTLTRNVPPGMEAGHETASETDRLTAVACEATNNRTVSRDEVNNTGLTDESMAVVEQQRSLISAASGTGNPGFVSPITSILRLPGGAEIALTDRTNMSELLDAYTSAFSPKDKEVVG